MNEIALERDEKNIDWMFAQTRHHPLLSAQEEQAIDRAKWQAVEELQGLLVDDEAGRNYLHQWAINLLENPPGPASFKRRDYYNLLKREQVELLAKGKHRAALISLSTRLAGAPSSADDRTAMAALHLPAVLVTGLAEVMLNEPEPREMPAALLHWRDFWTQTPCGSMTKQRAGNHKAIRNSLKNYYTERSKLVNHNLRLVYAIAGRINSRGLAYEDLVQGGMPGLIRAAEKYHHERGYRFSTYAYNWVNQSIRQVVENTQGIVRYPGKINEQVSRLYRERLNYVSTNGSEPSKRYLAQRLEMEPEALQRLEQANNLAVSMDTRVNSWDEGLSLAETLPGDTFDATTRDAEIQSLNHCLLHKLEVLQPDEQQVVTLRWGLEQLPPLTRTEVADRMQVSVEWVRQLERSALGKLRQDKGLGETYRDYFS
jgi:RNA polymerase sigma factor (sigma-70 family)